MRCNCCENRAWVEEIVYKHEVSIRMKNPMLRVEIALDVSPENAIEFANEIIAMANAVQEAKKNGFDRII